VHVFAGDGLGNGAKMVSFSASMCARQRVINCAIVMRLGTTIAMVQDPDGNMVECVERSA
jgi:hypothetical protein